MNFHGGNVYDYEKIIYDFSSNINPLGVPESFKTAISRDIDMFQRYPDIKYMGLLNSIKEYVGNSDASIILGNGAIDLIYAIITQSDCKRVYTIVPTFSEYKRVALNCGKEFNEIQCYSSDYFMIDIDLFLKEIQSGSLVILCNPNNPTGYLIDKETMKYIAERLYNKNCTLLIDEAFIEFTKDFPQSSFISHIKRYPNVIIIRALTKFFGMPGIRLGYALTYNKDIYKRVLNKQYPWNINTAAIIAGSTVLKDEKYIESTYQWLQEERTVLFDVLKNSDALKISPSQANFYLLEIVNSQKDAFSLRDDLLEHGILIRVPKGFTSLTNNHFRIAVLDKEANLRLLSLLNLVFKDG